MTWQYPTLLAGIATATLVAWSVPGRTAEGATVEAMASSAAVQPAVAVGTPAPAIECGKPTDEKVKAGQKIFTGAGNCTTCHGPKAKGTSLAPDLTDTTWIHIDGSYSSIAGLVEKGVPNPKSHPAPMPPMGGGNLSNQQVCEVAAYVFSLSHNVPGNS